MRFNAFNQPIGEQITHFDKPILPNIATLDGNYCRLEKLSSNHTDDLFRQFSDPEDAPNWTYLPDDQIKDYNQFQQYINNRISSKDPYFFSIINKTNNEAIGIIALLRIDPQKASIEVGHIHYANVLKRTRIATEVHYLLASYVFDTLGYRRYEWKCDALNEPSKKAAQRLGFKYEGTFRNHLIYKNRNRDTCWLSIIESEWQNIKHNYEMWLDENNFDESEKQLNKLSI
ncbi:GNAT family acetyltransferase [Staphylococcus succinus]|nr:GNAT family acetyltransferase [Staphylococcus succinus]